MTFDELCSFEALLRWRGMAQARLAANSVCLVALLGAMSFAERWREAEELVRCEGRTFAHLKS